MNVSLALKKFLPHQVTPLAHRHYFSYWYCHWECFISYETLIIMYYLCFIAFPVFSHQGFLVLFLVLVLLGKECEMKLIYLLGALYMVFHIVIIDYVHYFTQKLTTVLTERYY